MILKNIIIPPHLYTPSLLLVFLLVLLLSLLLYLLLYLLLDHLINPNPLNHKDCACIFNDFINVI